MSETTNIINAYRAHVSSFTTVGDESWSLIEKIAVTGQIKKGEFLLQEGKVCGHIDYIYRGALRAFSNKDGNEITTAIYLEDICITNMKSLSSGVPSTISIQALEDVTYARIHGKDLQPLYGSSTELQDLGRAILEGMVIAENDWKEMYSLYDPEERYLFLLKKSPAMLNRVPLQHIASFLGIRRETLSRIRNRTSRQK